MRSPGGMLPVSISKGLCVAEGQSSLGSRPSSLSNIRIPQSGVCTGPDWVKGASDGYVDFFASRCLERQAIVGGR